VKIKYQHVFLILGLLSRELKKKFDCLARAHIESGTGFVRLCTE
jgi:hypothetical protein